MNEYLSVTNSNSYILQTIDKQYLVSMHKRLLAVIRPKLTKQIDDAIQEHNLPNKLAELDKIVAETPHPLSHKAWRPSSAGSDLCVSAHDLKVTMAEKEELATMLNQLNGEVEVLEQMITEENVRMEKNKEIIKKNSRLMNFKDM